MFCSKVSNAIRRAAAGLAYGSVFVPTVLLWAADSSRIDYNREILPILSDNCFKCHGPDSATREAGLRLDQAEVATAELESGSTAVVPGHPDLSALIERVEADDEGMIMPPADSGKTLSEQQKAVLRQWISEGAHYAPHWAFVPPVRPAIPAVHDAKHVANAIDAFVVASLEANGLRQSPEASKERLIRRVTFDLTGLPPTLDEIDAFLADDSPLAYERLVDRLMESPRYGERMAVSWLDGARFADSNGYQNDYTRSMYPWRDWVISAFNNHVRYDQFLVEQLAGDLLPNPTLQQKIATGFNRNHRTVTEAGSIEDEWLVENVVDRTDTFGTVVLGLTVGCARCHDHKFDPISQREFYQLYAFFNNVDEKGVYEEVRGNIPPLVKVETAEHRRKLQNFADSIAALETDYADQRKTLADVRGEWLASLAKQPASNAPMPQAKICLDGNSQAQLVTTGATYEAAAGDKPPEWSHDLFGAVASFADGRQLVYPEIEFPTAGGAFSFTAFVKPRGAGAIVSKMDVAAGFRGFDVLLLDDGRIAVHLVEAWPKNAIKVISTGKLPKKTWTHVAVTCDGANKASGVAVYFNGNRQEISVEIDQLEGSTATTEPLRLGSRSTEQAFDGALREVRLFEAELSDSEVKAVLQDALAQSLPTNPTSVLSEAQLKEFDDLMLVFFESPVIAKTAKAKSDLESARKKRDEFDASIPTSMVMAERSEPRKTYLLNRGNYASPDTSEALAPSVPSILGELPNDAPQNRLGLAKWAVSPGNPLTARVMVNRLWQQMFGVGLVTTSDNFGVQSNPPVHQDVLDWLAVEFVQSGWDIQHIQRLIVFSSTYRQTSEATPADYEQDPSNSMLARGPRHRLSAESIRDNALAVSGLLHERVGGPSVMPYQPAGLWEELQGGAFDTYVQASGEDLYRRSLYTFRKRTVPHPSMATFDAPSWEICQIKRAATNTPLQALALLNDVTYVEAARAFAERIITHDVASDKDRLEYAFRLATGRLPSDLEIGMLADCLRAYRSSFASDPKRALELVSHGESARDESIDVTELAAHTALASVLLNLDETISKN